MAGILGAGGDRGLRRARFRASLWTVGIVIFLAGAWLWCRPFRGAEDLLVVGYDSSREYLAEAGRRFAVKELGGEGEVQSQHAGSVLQAENIIRGLSADVVLLASRAEMDWVQARTGCLDPDWSSAFPDGSSPYYSTIVFLVRNGNPHQIGNWQDLYERRLRVAMPDPRWSGAGRYAYLSLVAEALERHGHETYAANEEVRSLLVRMKLIPLGAQSAVNVFTRSPREDVFLTWESEALRLVRSGNADALEIVYPSMGIRAEPVVAVMECQTGKRGTTASAKAFIEFLYSPEGQRIAAEMGLRTRDSRDVPGEAYPSAPINLHEVETVFGDWGEVWKQHLGPEGSFAYAMKIRAALEGGSE